VRRPTRSTIALLLALFVLGFGVVRFGVMSDERAVHWITFAASLAITIVVRWYVEHCAQQKQLADVLQEGAACFHELAAEIRADTARHVAALGAEVVQHITPRSPAPPVS
jgi:hypothetical protein